MILKITKEEKEKIEEYIYKGNGDSNLHYLVKFLDMIDKHFGHFTNLECYYLKEILNTNKWETEDEIYIKLDFNPCYFNIYKKEEVNLEEEQTIFDSLWGNKFSFLSLRNEGFLNFLVPSYNHYKFSKTKHGDKLFYPFIKEKFGENNFKIFIDCYDNLIGLQNSLLSLGYTKILNLDSNEVVILEEVNRLYKNDFFTGDNEITAPLYFFVRSSISTEDSYIAFSEKESTFDFSNDIEVPCDFVFTLKNHSELSCALFEDYNVSISKDIFDENIQIVKHKENSIKLHLKNKSELILFLRYIMNWKNFSLKINNLNLGKIGIEGLSTEYYLFEKENIYVLINTEEDEIILTHSLQSFKDFEGKYIQKEDLYDKLKNISKSKLNEICILEDKECSGEKLPDSINGLNKVWVWDENIKDAQETYLIKEFNVFPKKYLAVDPYTIKDFVDATNITTTLFNKCSLTDPKILSENEEVFLYKLINTKGKEVIKNYD